MFEGFLEKLFIFPFYLILLGFFFSPFLIFFFNFYHDAKGNSNPSTSLVGVLTTRHHSKESRPEIQKSAGGRRVTRHGGGLLVPMLLLSQSGVTIEP